MPNIIRLAEALQEPNHSDFESIKFMFSVTLSNETIVSTYNRREDTREDSIKEEAKLILETGEDPFFVCMCALASVIGPKGKKETCGCPFDQKAEVISTTGSSL